MGKNKKLRKKRKGYIAQRTSHDAKLKDELLKSRPDQGLVEFWQKEISKFDREIEKVEHRLKKR
ncbi:MAG TPA: hypothetical protein VGX94_14145 [Terriglobia bacterium]|nr:hypothetical protein [Terriglobia bacterium]